MRTRSVRPSFVMDDVDLIDVQGYFAYAFSVLSDGEIKIDLAKTGSPASSIDIIKVDSSVN